MKVHELVARFAGAADSADPMKSARKILEELRADIAGIENALAYISGVGGNARQIFYRSPNLNLLKVCFPAGRRTPPHDHGTWATILLLSGEEKNTLYRREGGKLRGLAVTSLWRSSAAPEIPTVAESGYPGFEVTSWHGLLAPARTPATIVGKLHLETVKALALPDLRANFADLGLEGLGNSPDEFAVVIRSGIPKWAKVIKEAGIKPD